MIGLLGVASDGLLQFDVVSWEIVGHFETFFDTENCLEIGTELGSEIFGKAHHRKTTW